MRQATRSQIHRLTAATLGAAALLLLPAAPSWAAGTVLRAGATEEEIDEGGRLSNERTLSRWAHAFSRAKVRLEPADTSKSFTRLRYQTEDRMPEVYLALRSRQDEDGRTWIKLRVPMRPNGRTGWVRREALGPLNVVRTQLRINRRALTASLFKKGRRIWRARVGIGKRSTPTPRGRFYIRERLKALGGVYGPWAFGTSAYSDTLTDWPGGGVVGIHGTNQPHLIPGRPSHGCVRVRNRKISRLARIMPVGTPVRIR